MSELQEYRDSEEKKRDKAKELADLYLDEAKNLLDSLRDTGAAFSGPRLASLSSEVNEAVKQYNLGQYEASIAAAKNASVAAIEEIYKTDCEKQAWENYHKLALMLATEIETYLKDQEIITAEAKREMEKRSGKPLEDELVGVRVGDYTDKMKNGQSQFDYLLETVSKERANLESATPASVSLEKLKETAETLNGKIYPAAMTALYKGILNMNNAFARQNLSEEIVSFFEEHNFTFSGYDYGGDKHDGPLHIGLENELTGEEIVVTLSPEVMSSGDVQTRVAIDQIKGDERNEERKAYYRQAVQEVVAKGIPGASIGLECDQSTRNRLSPNVGLRDKLKR
jgi:Fe-S cluster biosynthesis and repair protein YggX